ncbi:E3 ubiquitin ligase family protein [Thermosynechococcaceae cyanobacterium BACA0444]|uniref:RING-type E3 ubiquitin transferase n=1 Tax=Pseudocalidococcus azoricus BACA0444 TaxID=2918990 RepID=A0AAE4FUG0_9CYAN|nr:E3 ubiquitin ligase family protein [Pseudocalidococcus azoricus]MDS3861772.1 E3 ubiquitin ligase family protein [Pseudocalidococcus azoricus BACA0444]
MLFISAILLIAAVVLFFVQRHYRLRLRSLKLANLVNSQSIQQLAADVATEIGGGSLREYVKLYGRVKSEHPLISELKQMPCVYYSMQVIREYEERVRSEDSEGRTEWRTERRSDTISSNTQSIPFFLQDAQGTVHIDPEGAGFETIQVLNEFRPEGNSNRLSFGGFSLNLDIAVGSGGGRTLGYRYQESILPLDRQVLIVGEASDQTGELVIGKPQQKGRKFFISLKSEDTLTNHTQNIITYTTLGAIASGVIGILVGILGLVS